MLDNRDFIQGKSYVKSGETNRVAPKVLIMCEYGSKDLKGFIAEDNEEIMLLDGSDAYDMGAADLTDYLSE